MAEPLVFINPSVLARIEDGSFVPNRKAKGGPINMPERRDAISPLAVARRCIRYEPYVFTHRKAQILAIANHLNNPDKKMIMIAGEQGTGKTSLIRGIVELMSSDAQQLLWFDANRHSDFSEIIQFLLHYITVICSALPTRVSMPDESAEPFEQLEALIGQISNVPLLIVIDNVEYIVDSDYRLNSHPFKEVMNFLLSFANIKMMLAGERLPYADMSPNQKAVSEVKLSGLSEVDMIRFIQERSGKDIDTELLTDLYHRTHGSPWLAKVLLYLYQHQQSPAFYEELDAMMAKENAPSAVTRFVFSHLNDDEKQMAQTMAMLRHPVNMEALTIISRFCHPALLGEKPGKAVQLEQTLIKPVLKTLYPPQEVLEHVQTRGEEGTPFKPWFELYRQIRKVIYNHLETTERDRLHGLLQDFYMNERNKGPGVRLTHLNNRALLGEAKFHSQMTRKRSGGQNTEAAAISESTAPSPIAEGGEEWLEAKTYLYQHGQPSTEPRRLTLEDYRKIDIPEEKIVPGQGRENPLFANLELTPEERALLFEDAGSTASETVVISPKKERNDKKEKSEPKVSSEAMGSDRRQELAAIADAFTSAAPVDATERELQKQLADAVAERNKPLLAQLLLKLAEYRTSRGMYHSAEECLDKVLALEPAIEPGLMADIHRLRGAIKQETYRHNEAIHELRLALKFLGQLGMPDQEKLGEVYQDLGEIFAYRNQHKEAVIAFEKAIDAFASAVTGNPEKSRMRLAEAHFQLAGLYDDVDNLDAALSHYQKSLAIDRELGHEESCASTLANLGHVLAALERLSEAVQCFQESMALDQKTRNPEGQIRTLDALSQLLPDKAETFYQKALAIAMAENNPLWQASVYLKLGNFYYRNRRLKDAMTHYQLALSSGRQELSDESVALLNTKIEEVSRVLS